jgi:predicted small lipoprotein YifL
MLKGMERRGAKAVIPVLLLLLLMLGSCGKKGPPLPPIEKDGAEAAALNMDNNARQG